LFEPCNFFAIRITIGIALITLSLLGVASGV
jgi:hypothetical protein